MPSELKARILDDVKAAMRAGDKPRVGALRMLTAAIKQREVDERVELGDADVLAVLEKQLKQRRESEAQYAGAGRTDLAEKERYEIGVIEAYLPEPLAEAELASMVEAAIAESGAASMRDMGKVMALLKPRVQGRTDMAALSGRVKARLAG